MRCANQDEPEHLRKQREWYPLQGTEQLHANRAELLHRLQQEGWHQVRRRGGYFNSKEQDHKKPPAGMHALILSTMKVIDHSQLLLVYNFQGILLVETSSATIEKNEISENIKANIALGGVNSLNTSIIRNVISGGRCEGIFVIESGQCWIMHNTICDNNDGIVCLTSLPDIIKNEINKNKSNGKREGGVPPELFIYQTPSLD